MLQTERDAGKGYQKCIPYHQQMLTGRTYQATGKLTQDGHFMCAFHCTSLESTGIITFIYSQYEDEPLNLSPAISILSFSPFFPLKESKADHYLLIAPI